MAAPDPLDALLSEGADAMPDDGEPLDDADDEFAEPEGDEFSALLEDQFEPEQIEALRSAILALTGPKLEM
jgi:hypothetical protein